MLVLAKGSYSVMDLTDWFNYLLGALQLAATILIAVTVRRASTLLARLQTERDLRAAWMNLDQWVMSEDERLKVADQLLHPQEGDTDIERRRHRWMCYLLRNPLEYAYMSAEADLVHDRARTIESVKASLSPLVKDDVFYSLVTTYTPAPHFVALCQQLRVGGVDSV